jgi:membrane protein DedA with SNARE-associated domain
MEALIHGIETYGLWLVFFSVLLDQGGLPTPSYAPMIVTAALATQAGQPLWPILLVGSFAALVADVAWFAGGRRYGAQLLRLMCRISLSPDSCVGTTRRFTRNGMPRR